MNIKLCKVGNNETVNFAADELKRYLYLIDENVSVSIFSYTEYNPEHKDAIWIMEDSSFAPEVVDVRFDDAFKIDIKDSCGYIAGTNPVSVLIAVYQLLKTLGCKWIRPGRDGEIIEKKTLTSINLTLEEKADYRFRGINLDCNGSVEQTLDMIDWHAKEGMNHYFFEHMKPYNRFKKYYKVSETDAIAAFETITSEAKKRGLKRHGVGHGWHMQALGFKDFENQGNITIDDLSEEQKSYLAMRDGKRSLYLDKNFFGTHLCYSKDEIRERMIEAVVNYLKENKGVDYLHFWLADGCNNHCECENCQKHRPSDWYVLILNDLDKRLREEKIESRIVCLIYVDLLWEPVEFKVENPDRFILMFAPITRTYDTSYSNFDDPSAKKTPYNRNKLIWPRSAAENALYLRDWQEKQLKGDSFLFDYHLMWNQYKEPGYRNLSRVIYEDMNNLKNLGLGGSISCEVYKCQIPHDFPHRIMARTLWNRKVDYDREEKMYFEEAYGEDFEKAFNYLDKVSDIFSVIYRYYNDAKGCIDDQKQLFPRVKALVEEYTPIIEENISKDLPRAQHISWELLLWHTKYILPFAKAYCEKYQKNAEKACKALDEFDKVCDEIDRQFNRYINLYFAKFSVRYYCDEITDYGPNVVLL